MRLDRAPGTPDDASMGSISVRRKDGSSHVVRTSKKTRFVRLAHEEPVSVNLAALGDTPARSELYLSTSSVIDALDLSPLAKHPALTSLTATIARAPDLTPLASTKLTSLSITLDGKGTLDFRPLHGHPTLEDLELGFVGTQKKLDLSFLRELRALTTLTIDGGDWKTLDLSPLEGLPLRSFTLVRQYIKKVDLALLAQPALEELTLAELDLRERFFSLFPLARCTKLRSLSLEGAEIGMLDVSALAKKKTLREFTPPNGSLTMMPSAAPILAPGLKRWAAQIGIE